MAFVSMLDSQSMEVEFEWRFLVDRDPIEDNTVELCGSFSNWEERHLMTREDDGVFRSTMILSTNMDQYEYKFVVNGEWCYDIEMPHHTDSDGNINNIIDVAFVSAIPVAELLSGKQMVCMHPIDRKFDQFVLAFDPTGDHYPWHGTWYIATPNVMIKPSPSLQHQPLHLRHNHNHHNHHRHRSYSLPANAAANSNNSNNNNNNNNSNSHQHQNNGDYRAPTPIDGVGQTHWTGVWRVESVIQSIPGGGHCQRPIIRFGTRACLTMTSGENQLDSYREDGVLPLGIQYGALLGLAEDPPHVSFMSNTGTRFVERDV